MSPALDVTVGGLSTANPVWIGSSELTMTFAGIRAAIDSGAGAVVAKSVNESEAARRQLDIGCYVFVAPDGRARPDGYADRADGLLNRSGLAQVALDDWVVTLGESQDYARSRHRSVIGSITLADPIEAARIATALATAVPALELNVGAPHGREAAGGAVRMLTESDAVGEAVATVRRAIDIPLLVKLPGQASDVGALARAALRAGADAVTLVGRYPGFLPDLDGGAVMGSWGAWSAPGCLPMSLYWISKLFAPDRSLVGTNGARDGDDVLRFLASGARAVELVTAVWVEGPQIVGKILAHVDDYLRQRERSLDDFVGSAVQLARPYSAIEPDATRWEPWARWLEPGRDGQLSSGR